MKLINKWAMVITILSAPAWAEPTLYPKNLDVLSKINNQTDSNILADEVDAKTIWVLPPNTAKATVSGMHSKTANMGFCAEMRDLQIYSRDLSADMRDVMKKRKEKQSQLNELQQRASEKLERAEAFAAEKNLTILTQLDSQIDAAESRISELFAKNETCKNDCEQVSVELNDLIREKSELMKSRREIARQNASDVREYTKHKRAADAARLTYENARKSFSELNEELESLRAKFHSSYASFGQMEGARAAISYKSGWDENTKNLKESNRGFNFSKMPTQNAVLMTELAGIDNIDSQGAIKSIGVGGSLVKGAANFASYPPDLSTNVVLSLIGACPMEHPEYFNIASSSVNEMQYGVTITYDYQTIFELDALVKYNMYKMYQRIVKSGSSGGFFRSRSWSTVEERNFFKDSFNVTWNDKENTFTQEDKDFRELEMRRSVLSRLATLALPNSPNRAALIQASEPPTRGAIVVSDQLLTACPTNAYCLAGAAVMSILDSIFGSSSSSSSYTNIQDIEVSENYKNIQKITKSAVTSYAK